MVRTLYRLAFLTSAGTNRSATDNPEVNHPIAEALQFQMGLLVIGSCQTPLQRALQRTCHWSCQSKSKRLVKALGDVLVCLA